MFPTVAQTVAGTFTSTWDGSFSTEKSKNVWLQITKSLQAAASQQGEKQPKGK